MEISLFLGVPILRHFRISSYSSRPYFERSVLPTKVVSRKNGGCTHSPYKIVCPRIVSLDILGIFCSLEELTKASSYLKIAIKNINYKLESSMSFLIFFFFL